MVHHDTLVNFTRNDGAIYFRSSTIRNFEFLALAYIRRRTAKRPRPIFINFGHRTISVKNGALRASPSGLLSALVHLLYSSVDAERHRHKQTFTS